MPAAPNAAKKKAQKAAILEAQKEKNSTFVEPSHDTIVAESVDKVCEEDEKPLVLAEEVCPAGKHQGKTFHEVAQDRPFCIWVCKEPRRGWMGLLKTYLETEHGFDQLPVEEEVELDPEEAEQAAKVAAARAKLLAKGKSKGQPKKPPASSYTSTEKPVALLRIPFSPTSDWQELLPEHICPKGLQFRMDMKTGQTFARLAS